MDMVRLSVGDANAEDSNVDTALDELSCDVVRFDCELLSGVAGGDAESRNLLDADAAAAISAALPSVASLTTGAVAEECCCVPFVVDAAPFADDESC